MSGGPFSRLSRHATRQRTEYSPLSMPHCSSSYLVSRVIPPHTAGCNYAKRSGSGDGVPDGIQPESPRNLERITAGSIRIGLSAFVIVHGGLHLLLRDHPLASFDSWFSGLRMFGGALSGVLYILSCCESNRYGSPGPAFHRGPADRIRSVRHATDGGIHVRRAPVASVDRQHWTGVSRSKSNGGRLGGNS